MERQWGRSRPPIACRVSPWNTYSVKAVYYLLTTLLFLTMACGEGSTKADPDLCSCDPGCVADTGCCDPVRGACPEVVPLSEDDLFARALVTQLAYQDTQQQTPRYFQTQWNKLGRQTQQAFLSGGPSEINSQLKKIFEEIQYRLTEGVQFLNLDDKQYRALQMGMQKMGPGEPGKDYLVISIRGTDPNEDENLKLDIEVILNTKDIMEPPGIEGSRVLKGPYETFLKTFKEPIEKVVQSHPGRDVYVLGHSLGGPVAAYAAQHLVGYPGVKTVSLYTYNSFRPGNYAFARWLNLRLAENVRHVTDKDVISAVPPKIEAWKPRHTGFLYRTNIEFDKKKGADMREYNSVRYLETQDLGYVDPGNRNGLELLLEEGWNKASLAHRFFVFGTDVETTRPTKENIPFLQ